MLSHADSLWPFGISPPGSSVHGVFQARILEWVATYFSREFSQGLNLCILSPALQADSLPTEPSGKPINPWSAFKQSVIWVVVTLAYRRYTKQLRLAMIPCSYPLFLVDGAQILLCLAHEQLECLATDRETMDRILVFSSLLNFYHVQQCTRH